MSGDKHAKNQVTKKSLKMGASRPLARRRSFFFEHLWWRSRVESRAHVQIPAALTSLCDDGIIERVVRPLMSGKEAQVFLVMSQGELRVAKVYKDADQRAFKHRAEYTEGRKTRNSRDQRALDKRSKHGRSQDEAQWKSAEVDMIHRLHAGGVRVPTPYVFMDGVLVMECVVDPDGNPAPRLGDRSFTPEVAQVIYGRVMREVVRMLAVGVVHGDLSDYNVLLAGDEPVVIDFPQSVDTSRNTNARRLLIRDVDNLHNFLARFVPRAPRLPYAEEMWDLHENNALTAETQLTGRYRRVAARASDDSVLDLIRDADRDERKRRDALGIRGGPRPVEVANRFSSGAPRQVAPPDRGPDHRQGSTPNRGPDHRQGSTLDRGPDHRQGSPPNRGPDHRQVAPPNRGPDHRQVSTPNRGPDHRQGSTLDRGPDHRQGSTLDRGPDHRQFSPPNRGPVDGSVGTEAARSDGNAQQPRRPRRRDRTSE